MTQTNRDTPVTALREALLDAHRRLQEFESPDGRGLQFPGAYALDHEPGENNEGCQYCAALAISERTSVRVVRERQAEPVVMSDDVAGSDREKAQAIIDADPRLEGMDAERLRLARALAAHPSCLGCGAAGDGGVTYCATHGDWLCERCVAAIRSSDDVAGSGERLRQSVGAFIDAWDNGPKGSRAAAVAGLVAAYRAAAPTTEAPPKDAEEEGVVAKDVFDATYDRMLGLARKDTPE
jgi:hypothetical protein